MGSRVTTAADLVGEWVRWRLDTWIASEFGERAGQVVAVTRDGLVVDELPLTMPRAWVPGVPDPDGTPRRVNVRWVALVSLAHLSGVRHPISARTLPHERLAAGMSMTDERPL